jgi:hypothetical protein
MSLLQNSNAISSGSYDINNSLRFRSSASAFLNRTPASAGDRQKFTISVWIKRGTLSTEQAIITQGSGNRDIVRIGSDNLLYFYWYDATYYPVNTTQVFRDPSAWYHIVVSVDTTQATSSNRIKLYVNGSQITALSNAIYPSQNFNFTYWGTTNAIAIGKDIVANNAHLDGYMAEFHFIDGSQKTPSDFGATDATTGVWQPKAYTGTYGTNGFYLKFSDIATTSGSNAGLGKDFSGNTNYWTTNNISVTAGTTYDAMIDSPTLTSATVANYCTLNPLVASTTATITNANLSSTGSTTTFANARATFTLSSGKWYWEQTITGSSTLDIGIGLCTEASQKSSATNIRQTGWYNVINGGSGDVGTSANGGANVNISTTNWATNDIIMVAYDADTGYIWFGRNGTWYPPTTGGSVGNPAAGTNQTISAVSNLIPASWHYNTNAGTAVNFGQRPFSYTPPTGYVALNTYNLPTPTILQGSNNFGVLTYTGNGSTSVTRSDTNAVNFTPDFVWIKSRSSTNFHNLYDVNRIVSGDYKRLYSNATNAEESSTFSGATNLNGFVNGGFTTGAGGDTNTNAATYVAWQWKANGAPSSNTSGSITSTVSANTTAGFSVVTYTGAGTSAGTVGHGLGVAPKLIIAKTRGNAQDWVVYHSVLGINQLLILNSTGAASTISNYWGSSAPTSTVFGVYTANNIGNNNYLNIPIVAYCWAEIAGFSKFTSFVGNGSSDGPFVYLGFRPKYILLKGTNVTQWIVEDTSRSAYNVSTIALFPNLSDAEQTNRSYIDFLSNGFKLRDSNADSNASGVTYIVAAWAENPFRNSLAR